ncbi:MAG: hypothetical protein JO314_04950 [Acidobacteria bacterium]|nr:hypothetical protein [Acidobacteriota bacterium]
MQKIQFFLSSLFENPWNHNLEFVEEVTGYDLPTTAEGIWQLFTMVTGKTPLRSHLFYMSEIEPLGLKPSNGHSNGHAPKADPKIGWHKEDVYRISYNDIDVLIDRTIVGNIDIRVWKSGHREGPPYAVLSFSLEDYVCGSCGGSELGSAECTRCDLCILCCSHDDERNISGPYHVVRELDSGKLLVWSLKRVLAEINRDRSGSWSNYSTHDWEAGWQEFIEGNDYELLSPATGFKGRDEATRFCAEIENISNNGVELTRVYDSLATAIDAVCDRDTQEAIAREYRRQIVLCSNAGKTPASEWILKAKEVYRGIDADLN